MKAVLGILAAVPKSIDFCDSIFRMVVHSIVWSHWICGMKASANGIDWAVTNKGL